MKKNEIKVGGTYVAKVSDKLTTVRIDSVHSRGGWNATNTATGKRIHIKSAQRLRAPAKGEKAATAKEPADATMPADAKPATTKAAKPKTPKERKPKRISALDAAAQVLQKADKPMRATEMIVAMAEQGLWESPAGRTPHATLYAAIQREIAAKGDAARFRKVERGQFEFAAAKAG